MLPNIHTHHPAARAILNMSEGFECKDDVIYSAGLHPWFIKEETIDLEFDKLKNIVSAENIWAIGECGLDKVCRKDWQLQQRVFIDQIKLAQQVHKPLILHCVRAYEEVMHLLKEYDVHVPVIFHGFNKSLELAQQLIAKGYFLSFGTSIFSPQKASIFRQVPIERLFLETDSEDVSIDMVYAKAAAIKELSKQDLIDQIDQNILSVFGKSL